MTFEQPASLNRYITPVIRFTWDFHRRLFKIVLPELTLISILSLQTFLLQQWETGRWEPWSFLVIPFLFFFLFFSREFLLWMPQKRKRFLRLEEKYVQIDSGLANRIPWKQITGWQINAATGDDNYSIVTMEYLRRTGKRRPWHRRTVLAKSQAAQLVSELKHHKQRSGSNFSISDQQMAWSPPPFGSKPIHWGGIWLNVAGGLFLFDGSEFLLAVFQFFEGPPNRHLAHFSSVSELRHFFLLAGGILCGSGVLLMIWGTSLCKKQKTQNDLFVAAG